ncbi:MAG: STAS domain-containing protein [Phycisphaerales bacterium]|nr:STAS domain-containing protein [Phycisphaerales bacterium]
MADPKKGQDSIQIRAETVDGATVVSPVGDVDLTASPVLRNELKRVHTSKPPRLVIDLSQVPYMDSSGVATLVEAMQISRKNGTKLVLCSMQPRVKSIFEIARLDTVFTIVADKPAALAK